MHDVLTSFSSINSNRFKTMHKLMAKQSGLDNQRLTFITDEYTPLDKIESVLVKGTDVYNFLAFNCSDGDGRAGQTCCNCGKEVCEVSKRGKPLDRDLIKKN